MSWLNTQERRNAAAINAFDSVMWGALAIATVAVGNVVVDEFRDGFTFDFSDLDENTLGFIENNATWENAFWALLVGAFIEGWTNKSHSSGSHH